MDVKYDYNLKEYNTFGMDVLAKQFVEFSSLSELREIFSTLKPSDWYLLGGGSNILFTKDYDGLMIHSVGGGGEIVSIDDHKVTVKVDAGVEWDDFVLFCVENSLSGVENLSYIPGSVGASPVQNIGAYGVEVKDVISKVYCYFPETDTTEILSGTDCHFAYRHSIFKDELKGKAIVYSVEFELSKEFHPKLSYGNIIDNIENPDSISLKELRDVIVTIRKNKLPDPELIGNGGSFFKNPIVEQSFAQQLLKQYPSMPHFADKNGVKIPAAWLIDSAGWKGYREADAGVHVHQALVLVNYGSAKPQEILSLANRIIESVESKFSITISAEINLL